MTAATQFAIPAALRDRAREAAGALGERLLHRAQHAPADDAEFMPMRGLVGSPGFALACMALAQCTGDSRYEAAMHGFIRAAAAVDDVPSCGLFDGISGTRAVAALLTVLEPRYRKLVEQCDRFVDSRQPSGPALAQTFAEFDLISGYGGIRLARCVEGASDADAWAALLAWTIADDWRWCCVHPVRGGAPENDIGLAHGAAGMIAALALTVPNLAEWRPTVIACARALAAQSTEIGGMRLWPYSTQQPSPERFRSAWCYGAPGVAGALYAAARTCNDADLERFALDALVRTAPRPSWMWNIEEAGLCHGLLGNALVFASCGSISGNRALLRACERATEEAVDAVVRDGWRCMARGEDGRMHETFSHLVGSAGAITALLTLAGDFDPSWMRLYALEPLS